MTAETRAGIADAGVFAAVSLSALTDPSAILAVAALVTAVARLVDAVGNVLRKREGAHVQ